jgi:hypothetical protein
MAAVNQSLNSVQQKAQSELNYRNVFYDEQLNEVAISTVQQINDRAYYRRGQRWIDGKLTGREKQPEPTRIIAFGSREFFDLARRLARENRQGSIAMRGDILLMVDGEAVLIQTPNNN